MKNVIEDIKVWSDNSIIKAFYTVFLNGDFQCMCNYRLANFFYRKIGNNVLSKVIMYFNKIVHGADIDCRARISGGVKLCHGLGIVIGKDVIIEENVKIYQGVTLGGNQGRTKIWNERKISQPVILRNSIVYAGSVVIGPVVVGPNSVVGALTLVTKDVPENCVAKGKNEFESIS